MTENTKAPQTGRFMFREMLDELRRTYEPYNQYIRARLMHMADEQVARSLSDERQYVIKKHPITVREPVMIVDYPVVGVLETFVDIFLYDHDCAEIGECVIGKPHWHGSAVQVPVLLPKHPSGFVPIKEFVRVYGGWQRIT